MAKTIVGYARTSTLDQTAGLEAQLAELKQAGCERIFQEQVSSVDVVKRDQLAQALAFVREGDIFICTKLDRLARNMAHLMEIVAELEKKKVALRILNLGIDTSTPTGRLILTMLGGIAEFERSIMLERQREGIRKAKLAGKYKGRKATARAKTEEVLKLLAEGAKPTDIAQQLGIGRRSVYRIKGDAAGEGDLAS